MRVLLVLLLLLPHMAVFVYAGVREYRAWRDLESASRPSFLAYLGREQGPADRLAPQHTADRLLREADRTGRG